LQILSMLLDAGTNTGDLRADADPLEVGTMMAGLLSVSGAPDQRRQLDRMFTVVVDGLRPRH
jgi:hypothetical protein